MRASPLRLAALAAAAALLAGSLGFAWHALHFGFSDDASAARLEREVRQLVADRTRQVRSLAERVSRDGEIVQAADANPGSRGALFAHLQEEAQRTADADRVSISVYVPTVSRAEYRLLAWSDGAAEDLKAAQLSGHPALFVSRSTGGLLLGFVRPIESGTRRVGVAAAETVLAPAAPGGTTGLQIDTSFGPVTVEPALFAGAGATDTSGTFIVTGPDNEPLLHVVYSRAALAANRRQALARVGAAAAMPIVLLGLLLTGRLLARRARAGGIAPYVAWSGAIAALVGVGAVVLGLLARVLGAANALDDTLAALTALAAAALLPVSLWWRPGPRIHPRAAPLRFALEQALAGVVVAALLILLTRVSHDHLTAASLATWEFPLFPFDPRGLASLGSRLVLQIALCWTMATLLGALASRWRLTWRAPDLGLLAAGLWLGPAVLALTLRPGLPPLPPVAWTPIAGALAAFALVSTTLRRHYRRTTQAIRLLMLFGALFLPTLALYPMADFHADAATRALIAREYSPVLAEQPQRARAELARAQAEIEARLPQVTSLIASARDNTLRSQDAFTIWRETSLSRTRVTSDIELYGPDGSQVSRFALNIPEYAANSSHEKWSGSGCAWQTFDDPRPLGGEDRRVFRAERGLCEPGGGRVGAVVVHIVIDYQSLPFVTSANPYADVLASPDRPEAPLGDLQVGVYGWSLYPVTVAGQLTWPISPDVYARLYRSREPFWETILVVNRLYQVYFTSDRGGIYALGYPVSTPFEHATRLAESVALTGVLFVLLLVGAAIYGPFAGRRDAPLRVLFDEIRTSFYRKLFLFFVFAAIVPVLMFALAFGAYMQSKFRDDVVSEATKLVTVARRMVEEFAAVPRPDQSPIEPTDDMMVWIGQVIHQPVNLFTGSGVQATSQRDLFESGLLPMRTPAGAYRRIALDRLPAFVTEDRLASAAAPVPAYGPDAVLSVSLANRQREIEQQIADLDRGVLVGAVVVVLFAAGLGASVAGRIADPVARLTRATRQIAAGRLDVRIVADTADELRRLVDAFNSMAATLVAQRTALARTNQLKAWNEMARQVAHEIKNPLTPIQLSTEHLQRVHEDAHRPLGAVFDQCTSTILRQVRLLRQIAGEFSNFAGEPTPRPADVNVRELVEEVVAPYRTGLEARIAIEITHPDQALTLHVDRTLVARALTNVIENALHAMPTGGTLRVTSGAQFDGARGPGVDGALGPGVDGARGLQTPGQMVTITMTDTGVGMDDEAVRRAFEPYFSTRTAGSGLGLANAKRNVELCGGTIALASVRGRGTTVTVTLPSASAAPAGRATG